MTLETSQKTGSNGARAADDAIVDMELSFHGLALRPAGRAGGADRIVVR
jgi:hypothetical protein